MPEFDQHPLQAFLQDHAAHLQRLAETGRPEVLTVDGQPRVVVQDAAAYAAILDLLATVDSVRVLRERLDAMDSGVPGIPLDAAVERLRRPPGLTA